MEIDFKDKKLRELCEQKALAEHKLGRPCAQKLRSRLSDLLAARCVSDLMAGRPHPLHGDREGQFTVDLHGGRRLVFISSHNPVPRKEDGGIDWTSVTQNQIIYVGDYHD